MSELLSTKEYDKFHYIKGNRVLDEKKIIAMSGKIQEKNFLKEFPIVVTPKLGILDGQHRYESAKRTKTTTYYIVSSQMSVDDVAEVNKTVKKWSIKDYVYLFHSRGKEDYTKLLNYSENWGLSIDIVLRIFQLDTGTYNSVIKLGDFKFHQVKEHDGVVLYNKLQDFAIYFKSWTARGFIYAFRIVSKQKGYVHDIMKQKLAFQSRSLVRCVDTDAYIEMLAEIYNYRNTNRIEVKR